MKISVLYPENYFSPKQKELLGKLGEVQFIDPPIEHNQEELKKFVEGSEIVAVDPDNFGGFELAKTKLTDLMESLPNLKGLALDTTSFGWVDLEYCKKRNIIVTNTPGFSRETVAEYTLALLLNLAKKIIQFDRKTQQNQYKLEMSFELKGKTLGIIGLGNIGSRVAELGNCIGMKVIAYNRSTKEQPGVEMKSLDEILKLSDAISLHTTHEEENHHLIGKDQLMKMKNGVIIVNLVDRDLVDEKAMSDAIKSGKVAGYAYEGEDLENTPLAGLENAIGLKPFGWYTKEALDNLFQIWTENIIGLAQGSPKNPIS